MHPLLHSHVNKGYSTPPPPRFAQSRRTASRQSTAVAGPGVVGRSTEAPPLRRPSLPSLFVPAKCTCKEAHVWNQMNNTGRHRSRAKSLCFGNHSLNSPLPHSTVLTSQNAAELEASHCRDSATNPPDLCTFEGIGQPGDAAAVISRLSRSRRRVFGTEKWEETLEDPAFERRFELIDGIDMASGKPHCRIFGRMYSD